MKGTIAAIGVFFCALAGLADERYLNVPVSEIEEIMILGYNLDPRTEALIDGVADRYPESPVGPCLKAARLFRINDYAGGTNATLEKRFEEASRVAIEASKNYYEAHPDDPAARYALAMCELNLARFYIDRGRWFSGFFKATSGLNHLKSILKKYPDFHDAKMPLGVANCFLDKTPAYLKPIAALLRFSGDMELGLQQLHDAETKGFLTRYESLYYQIGVQWELLEDKDAAGAILDRFIDLFPRNVDAIAMKAHLDRRRERYEDAFDGYQRILAMDEVSYLGDVRDWLILHSGNMAIRLEKPEIALEKGAELLAAEGYFEKEMRAWGHLLRGNARLHMDDRDASLVEFAQVKRRDSPEAYKAMKGIVDGVDGDDS